MLLIGGGGVIVCLVTLTSAPSASTSARTFSVRAKTRCVRGWGARVWPPACSRRPVCFPVCFSACFSLVPTAGQRAELPPNLQRRLHLRHRTHPRHCFCEPQSPYVPAACRHRHHHHHDPRRAHQVPLADSKRKLRASQVAPDPPIPHPPPHTPPTPPHQLHTHCRIVSNGFLVLYSCRRYAGPLDCAKQILKESGVRGLCDPCPKP